jgi:hypothetical protein
MDEKGVFAVFPNWTPNQIQVFRHGRSDEPEFQDQGKVLIWRDDGRGFLDEGPRWIGGSCPRTGVLTRPGGMGRMQNWTGEEMKVFHGIILASAIPEERLVIPKIIVNEVGQP